MAKVSKRRGRYVIDYYDPHGKRRWLTMPKESTLKQSKDKLREIEDGLARGVLLPVKQVPTFKEVAESWIAHKKANVRSSTLTMYNSHVLNHFETVNHVRINRITVAMVEKFIADQRGKGVSLPTLKKILISFGQVFKYAIRHRYVDHNPVSEAERPRGQGEEEPPAIRVLKPDEINKLITSTVDRKARMLFLLAVMSGARQGELFGLKWSDVLFEGNQIHIQRTFNNAAWYRPKTPHSVRKIDIGPKVMGELKKWRIACPPNELDLVFPGDQGKPLTNSHVLRMHFLPALKAAGLPTMRFHDLRHTYASLLIHQGENIKYIQKQLGHSKPTVTLDIYAHLMEENNPAAADRLENAILAGW